MRLDVGLVIVLLLASSAAHAAPWSENKQFFTENAGLASSMVDAADLDNDGYVDLVFANGVGYDKGTPDSDLPQQAFHNNAGVGMTNISEAVFGFGVSYNGRAVKLRDVEGDGDIDIVLGTIWSSQTQLLLNDGVGNFTNETATHLPQIPASIGDLEFGDLDGDGDLDLVLADWGSFSPVSDPQAGGVTQVWTQMGVNTGMFEDGTLDKMQNVPIRWSWDIELIDVNNDFTLDLVVSCFACDKNSLYLFANNGDGKFTDLTPNINGQGSAALDVEAVDLNGDNFFDLVSLHDAVGGRNRVLLNDQMGGFADVSDLIWPKLQNPSSYDHTVATLDYNSDGLPDLAIGALQPGANKYPNRLMDNQAGKLSQNTGAFEEAKPSPGTYGIVLADFNLDRVLDMAMSQNENATEKKVFIGTMELAPDTAAPRLPNYEQLGADIAFGSVASLRVRAHDNKSPVMPHDFQRKVDRYADGRPYVESWSTDPSPDLEMNPGTLSAPGVWYGEALWKITFTIPDMGDRFAYRICAIDAAHNKACTPLVSIDRPGLTTTDDAVSTSTSTDTWTGDAQGDSGAGATAVPTTTMVPTTTAAPTTSSAGESTTTNASSDDTDSASGTGPILDDSGCVCDSGDSGPGGVVPGSLLLLLLVRRRTRRAGLLQSSYADWCRTGGLGRLPACGAHAYPRRVTLVAHSSLALAASLLLAGACYDGDHLGFVPCEASDECDAPPRAKSRRECLRSQVKLSAPGYCALPCDSAEACADEAPGTAAQEAICMGEGDMTSGHCVLPCNSSQPCPANMQCIGYSAASCDDSGNCICFPATLGAEG